MPTSSRPDGQLIEAVRQGLLPQRFPARRDVEAAGAARADASYDLFWPRLGRLALVAYRVRPETLSSALAMAAFRHLFRAVAPRCETAEDALAQALAALGRAGGGAEVEAAAVFLDVSIRHASFASRGLAYAGPLSGAAGAPPRWVGVVGLASPASLRLDDGEGLETELDRRLGGDPAIAALAAVRAQPSIADPGDLVFVVANHSAAVAALLPEIEARCALAGLSEATAGLLSLVVDEMMANVVSYAYRDGAAHEVVLRLRLEDGRAFVSIEDDGSPFDPLGADPPDLTGDVDERPLGGLGVHFLRTVAADIRYERRRGWNVLCFIVGPGLAPDPS